MNKQLAQDLIENWNGEDYRFLFQGEIYTEDDVDEAQDYLKNLNK